MSAGASEPIDDADSGQRPATSSARQALADQSNPSFIMAFGAARTFSAGHTVRHLPGVEPPLALHQLAPATSAHGVAPPDAPLRLVLLDGIGKAALDGDAQRVSAPALLRVPAAAAWTITNQGVTGMRVLVVW